MKPSALDELLRTLVNHEGFDPSQIVALGRPAFERLLLAVERKAPLTIPGRTSDLDGRAYEDGLQAALAAFAADDLQGVLAELRSRQWSDERITLSGLGRVKDERMVPILVVALANSEPMTRLAAVNSLGVQRDSRATEALVRALADRSSQVRSAAVDALCAVGDARAIEALKAVAARPARPASLADRARQGLKKMRRK
jgi:HEAT repeat protein